MKILWISPNLNIYKIRFLEKLTQLKKMEIVVLSGKAETDKGHAALASDCFETQYVDFVKGRFAFQLPVYTAVLRMVKAGKFDAVLMPSELKFLPLIVFCFVLKFLFRFEMVTYTHPYVTGGRRTIGRVGKVISRCLFSLYDRVSFYTKSGLHYALDNGLVPERKASYASNTLDTSAIWQNYSFSINTTSPKVLLFIGRLLESKRLDILFDVFETLKKDIPDLQLKIIGDGPMRDEVQAHVDASDDVHYLGRIFDESIICDVMRSSHVVFIPGASGLSVVHSFCYGKPYITMDDEKSHGPEIAHLEHGVNGLFLRDANDLNDFKQMLQDESLYEKYCRNAWSTAQELTIEKWCDDLYQGFTGTSESER
jgi:glycosyltransferase involved in cell wall biosynthesis